MTCRGKFRRCYPPTLASNLLLYPVAMKMLLTVTARFTWIALALTLSFPAVASPDSPKDFMKERQTELFALAKQGAPGAKKMESAFDRLLDYEALAQGALRDHWAARTEAERSEFTDVLKRLVRRAYRRNLDRTADYDVRFEGESKEADRFLIRTTAQSRKNVRQEPVSIDYVVRKAGDAWRVQDIVTEGSSLVGNYHHQFNRIIKKDGFGELIRRMKTKLDGGG